MKLSHIKTLLIDGDGVLWRLNDPMPGLNRFFDTLKDHGINWALLTNNSTRTIASYVKKLEKFGVTADPAQVFSSASVTGQTLADRYESGTAFYVIGEDGIKDTLRERGFTVYDDSNKPDEPTPAVVLGLDVNITYQKLAVATQLIRGGAKFIATNPDKTFPSPYGILPGAGTFIAALESSTNTEAEVIGKPKAAIFEAAMSHFGGTPETTAMLGDRMETDILGAQAFDLGTILVLTGITQKMISPISIINPTL